MKARKIEFKSIESTEPSMPGTFHYKEGVLMIVDATRFDQNGNSLGMMSDEILKAVEIKTELKKAEDAVILSEEYYLWLLAKLNTQMRWRVATDVVAQFITDFRNAPQVEVDEKGK